MQDAREVVLALDEIAALLAFVGAPRFKAKAYEHGARVAEQLGEELGALIEQGRLTEVEGIGPSLSHAILELWNTGQSRVLTRLRSELPRGASELIQVEGLTPKRIRTLGEALGIGSVDELVEACRRGAVRQVKGMGEKTEARLLAAAERWRARADQPLLLLRTEALELGERLVRQLVQGGHATRALVAGALRRGEETVAELELVAVGDRTRVFEGLARLPSVLQVDGATGRARLARGVRLVVHVAGEDDAAAAELFATGDAKHLAALAEHARTMNRELTPKGVMHHDKIVNTPGSEEHLYAALGLAWVPPELRTGQGEVAQAATTGFGELVSLDDVRGMVHCHTVYSDGRDDIETMARAAEALGMAYITITDHSPSAHYAQGVALDRLKAQWDEIAEVQERVAIRILRGTESDILADGSLDYPDDVLTQFDVVIASIHARHRQDRAAMTARLVRAMSLPLFKIWGHGLGRILLHRDPIECDVPAVLDALAASRGAIELNGDPHRLDLPPAWIPAARARGIPFVVSVDAHSTRGLGVLHHAVTLARRGGLTRGEVLNTLPAEAFAARVGPA